MLQGILPGISRSSLALLERFRGRPVSELAKEYWQSREGSDRAAQERVAAAGDEAALFEYYQQTQQYLYELTYIEGSVKRQGWLKVLERTCRRFNLQHLLDVGAGIGSVSLFLGRRGIRCDYLDVPGRTFDYAAWRFAQQGLNVAMHEATKAWPAGPYDGVIAWDVFEHLKDLEGKIAWLGRALRPAGRLLHWSTFTDCEHVHLPENMRYGDIRLFDALLQRHGFGYRGQLKPDRLSRLLRRLGWRTATLGIRLSPRLKYGGGFLIHERLND